MLAWNLPFKVIIMTFLYFYYKFQGSSESIHGTSVHSENPSQVEEYLRALSHPPPGSQGVAAIPLGKHVRDDEQVSGVRRPEMIMQIYS